MRRAAACVFEYIYFRPSRTRSSTARRSTRPARRPDVTCARSTRSRPTSSSASRTPASRPPSAMPSIRAFPYGVGLIKNRYIGRTFIQPGQDKRERSVRLKLNALRRAVEGKRVVMVDDSIVRGTTVARLVKLIRDAGAKEVHMRISAPPFRHPCFFGTDIPGPRPAAGTRPHGRGDAPDHRRRLAGLPVGRGGEQDCESAQSAPSATPALPAFIPCRCPSAWRKTCLRWRFS